MHQIQEKLLELSKKLSLKGKSLREIGDLVGVLNQPQKIKHHLAQLEKKGFINSLEGDSNQKSAVGLISVPILGAANCGEANMFADDNIEGYLKVSPAMLKKKNNIFAIRATGFSMNRANVNGESIDQGDFVIVDSENKNPQNGDYIISIIDGVANIKKINIDEKRKQIILLSESSKDYSPIYIHAEDADCYHVGGRVMQVIKKPR
ncbi:MAG: S24 family peptidase [Patescibacteria group bacterium]